MRRHPGQLDLERELDLIKRVKQARKPLSECQPLTFEGRNRRTGREKYRAAPLVAVRAIAAWRLPCESTEKK